MCESSDPFLRATLTSLSLGDWVREVLRRCYEGLASRMTSSSCYEALLMKAVRDEENLLEKGAERLNT